MNSLLYAIRKGVVIKKYLRVVLVVSLCILASNCYGKTPEQSSAYSMEAYFSPDGHINDRIVKAIDSSILSIDLAIFDFTAQDIKSAFDRAKNRGVKIRIVADSRQAKGVHSVIQTLINEGFDIKIVHGIGRGIMHNKFAVFDKKLLVTGSYNWTNNAEHFNYENAIFITDLNVIMQYQKDFDNIWGTAPNIEKKQYGSEQENKLNGFPDEIKAFINSSKWTYAKTMPEYPHYYIVRHPDNEDMFVKTVEYIRMHGYEGRFYKQKNIYFDDTEYSYWTMGAPIAETTIINRCLKEDTYEKRLANGTLP